MSKEGGASELDKVRKKIEDTEDELARVKAAVRRKNPKADDDDVIKDEAVKRLDTRLAQLQERENILLKRASTSSVTALPVFDMSKLEEKFHQMEIKLEETVERVVQPLRLTLHTMDNRLPLLIQTTVTPSQASQDEEKYRNTHEALSLGTIEKRPKLHQPASRANLIWSWNDDARENDSYETVCEYIEADRSYRALNVSAGQVYGKDLYKRQVYSLRSKAGAHRESITYLTTIHGRTDILVFHERNYEEPVPNTRLASYAIEVKTAKEMSRMGHHIEREVEIQLLGLNIANSFRHASPPVLLTNLTGTNDVYYVERTTDDPLKYTIICQPCSTFARAIEFIETELLDRDLGYRKSVTQDLGRAPTPDTSNSEIG